MKKFLWAGVLLTVLSGCTWFLPDGDPPDGNILENPRGGENPRSYTLREGVDYLTSMLTLKLMEVCPGEMIGIDAGNNPAAYEIACIVLRQSGKLSGNRQGSGDSAWQLKSSIKEMDLSLQLEYNGKAVWQESITITK